MRPDESNLICTDARGRRLRAISAVVALLAGVLTIVLPTAIAGAAVTMTVTPNACSADVTISGLDTGPALSFLINADITGSVPDQPAFAFVEPPTTAGADVTVTIGPLDGAGTLYLYSLAGWDAPPVAIASAPYDIACTPVPFRFIPTTDLNLGQMQLDGQPLILDASVASNTALPGAGGRCTVEVSGPVVDGEIVVPAGSELLGECRGPDPDQVGWAVSRVDVSTASGVQLGSLWPTTGSFVCSGTCTLTGSFLPLYPQGGGDFDAKVIIDGLRIEFGENVDISDFEILLTMSAPGSGSTATCSIRGRDIPLSQWIGYATTDFEGVPFDFANGVDLSGTYAGVCWWGGLPGDVGALTVSGIEYYGYVPGTDSEVAESVDFAGMIETTCSSDAALCTIHLSNRVPTVPSTTVPSTTAPATTTTAPATTTTKPASVSGATQAPAATPQSVTPRYTG